MSETTKKISAKILIQAIDILERLDAMSQGVAKVVQLDVIDENTEVLMKELEQYFDAFMHKSRLAIEAHSKKAQTLEESNDNI